MGIAAVAGLGEFCLNFWRKDFDVVSNQYVIGWVLSNDLN